MKSVFLSSQVPLSAVLFLLILLYRDGKIENTGVTLKDCRSCCQQQTGEAAAGVAGDDQSTLLKEEDVEIESQRVESIDAECETTTQQVFQPFYDAVFVHHLIVPLHSAEYAFYVGI